MAKAKPVAGLNTRSSVFVNTALIISTRIGEMRAYERYLSEPDRSDELHQMRIAAKRVRYTMEIFEPVYVRYTSVGVGFSEAIAQVKSIQEHLGAVHDSDVLVPQLTAHLGQLLKRGGEDKRGEPQAGVHLVDFDACQGLLTMCQEMRARRDKNFQKLLAEWQRLQGEQFFDRLQDVLKAAITETAAR